MEQLKQEVETRVRAEIQAERYKTSEQTMQKVLDLWLQSSSSFQYFQCSFRISDFSRHCKLGYSEINMSVKQEQVISNSGQDAAEYVKL